jgi:hypothetical protein
MARPGTLRQSAWHGGFVLPGSEEFVACIAAVDGTVVAASSAIYRLRPGETRFQRREPPGSAGDVFGVAVEPRQPGRVQRFACGFMGALHIYDGQGVATVDLDDASIELARLMWGPGMNALGSAGGEPDTAPWLYMDFGDKIMCLIPDDSRCGAWGEVTKPISEAQGMARDDAGGMALARLDEETWDLDVWIADVGRKETARREWGSLGLPAPDCFQGCELAIAGRAVAVSFDRGGVWVTRDITQQEFREVEELQPLDPLKHTFLGGAIAFEGSTADAALFCARMVSDDTQAILRLDADGRVQRLADVTRPEGKPGKPGEPGEGLEPIRQMAWDATRRTLWCACGAAGVLCLAPQGTPIPLGAEGAEAAVS